MNNLQIFKNDEFGEVRTVTKDGEPYVVLKDVCDVLELTNPTIVMQRLDEDEVTKLDLGGQAGVVNAVNESGLYAVILRSDKPKAKEFRKWVTSEVLPAIRKTGSYNKPLTAMEQLKLQQQALIEVGEEIKEVKSDLEKFKLDLPLLAVECETITKAVRAKGIDCLGGKDSNAYRNTSLRSKVYADIYSDIKRNFEVGSYKAIKRNQTEVALDIIKKYELPYILKQNIEQCNSQVNLPL